MHKRGRLNSDDTANESHQQPVGETDTHASVCQSCINSEQQMGSSEYTSTHRCLEDAIASVQLAEVSVT